MPKQQQTEHRKIEPNGFTLIELLVVMSIMSMLMSILLPSMNQARELGQRVHCAANLRQLTFAWTMYATYNDDKVCSPETGWNYSSGNNWVADGPQMPGNDIGGTEQAIKDGVLWPYTQFVELYKCKSDYSGHLRSYSISRTMGWEFRALSEIPRSVEKMVFIDARPSKCQPLWIDGSFYPIKIDPKPPRWQNCKQMTARHSGGCNLSFADIHCEYWRWKDHRTLKLINGEIGVGDASEDNPDLERMVKLLKGRRY